MYGMECRRSACQSEEASNADGAGFAWSGGRAVSEVGCDVRHGVPKIRKPQRGRFLQEYGHTTFSSHAGLRWEAETERTFCVKLMSLMSCRAEADGTLDGGEAEGNEDEKAKRVCRGCAVLMAFPSLLPVSDQGPLEPRDSENKARCPFGVCVCVCVCARARISHCSAAASDEFRGA